MFNQNLQKYKNYLIKKKKKKNKLKKKKKLF
jgi:hypothetical protein